MNGIRLWTVVAAGLFATCLFGQGLDTKATKDDWEEINFEFNSSILSDGYPSLLRLADLFKQHPDYKLKLEGHTDYIGSVPYNEKLALARANTVKNFLVKYGMNASQISVSGQGKRAPEVSNQSKEGRFVNRRVVMTATDAQGRVIAAGGPNEIFAAIDERLKKLEECCSQILKRLDKLDDILAAVKDLKGENDRLKSDLTDLRNAEAGLKKQVDELTSRPKPLTSGETTSIARAEGERVLGESAARNKKFSLLGLNVGPTWGPSRTGDFSFTGKGRFFSPFGGDGTKAVQAEGEYLYYPGRQEGQFDIGLINRWNNIQAGLFSSFKYVNIRQFQNGGTLGQGAFVFDYLFSRGKVGFFGTKGFRDNVVINRAQLGPNSFTETYMKIVDQIGGSTTLGLFGDSYIEANLGYLKRHARGLSDRPGGMLRFVHPLSDVFALTVEAGLNETYLGPKDSGRVVFGFQYGGWLRPKDYLAVKHPVPMDIPRVRYELLARRVGNSAPVADAGPDQTGAAPGTITLDGSASYDPDGDTLTYSWEQVSGPSVSISGMTSARATFTALEGQIYIFRLTVKDPGGLQSTARVTISTRSALQVRILRFTAQPNAISVGQSSVLSWQVENADTVTLDGVTVDPRAGTSSVAPTVTTTYRLNARNRTSEVNETVTVTVARPDVRILRFEASPTNITAGEVSNLSWSTENAEQVTISPEVGTVAANGSRTVSPTQTTTYTLTATRAGQSVSASVVVRLEAGQVPRILRFSASPVDILAGEQSTLSWQVENATDVSISSIGAVQPSGTSTVSPTANTTYTLTARNAQGEVSAPAVVTVTQPVKILNFVANPTSINAGATATLTWSTQNATEVIITGIGPVAGSGSAPVNPAADTSYTLLAYGRRSQASAFVLLKVIPAAGLRGPIADAGPDQRTNNNSTLLDGTKSFSPDNLPLTYSWRFVNGPGTATITGGSTARPNVLMSQFGVYRYELTVRDNRGQSSSAFVLVEFIDP